MKRSNRQVKPNSKYFDTSFKSPKLDIMPKKNQPFPIMDDVDGETNGASGDFVAGGHSVMDTRRAPGTVKALHVVDNANDEERHVDVVEDTETTTDANDVVDGPMKAPYNDMARNFPTVSGLNLWAIYRAASTTKDCIAWLRSLGLLATEVECTCGRLMKESLSARSSDGLRWRCSVRTCRRECSIRKGSFFEGSSLRLEIIICFMFMYSFQAGTTESIKNACGLASEASASWRNNIRGIFAEYFINHPQKIGGAGHTVEIREFTFNKRKVNIEQGQWVIGGVDVETREGFLVPVEHRDADSLLQILKQYVLPGTTLTSDLWRVYNTLEHNGYTDLTANHFIKFVDLGTTTHVQSMWSDARKRMKAECGIHRSMLSSYLYEFMWRKKFGDDPFQHLINQIRGIYPVCTTVPRM